MFIRGIACFSDVGNLSVTQWGNLPFCFRFHSKAIWTTSVKTKNEDSWMIEWRDLFQLYNNYENTWFEVWSYGLKWSIIFAASWILSWILHKKDSFPDGSLLLP